MEKLTRIDIIRELIVLDLICKDEDTQLNIALFGGASILLQLGDELFRGTKDIDYKVESVSSEAKLGIIREAMPNTFEPLNGLFPQFPDQELYMENGIQYHKLENVQFENITIFLPSMEMLALSKLMSDRQKDLDDLLDSPIMNQCDLRQLKEYVDEAETYLFNTRQFNFLQWDDILLARGLSYSLA